MKEYSSVDQYLDKLQHPLHSTIQLIRTYILEAHPLIKEHIKWNVPAYYYEGKILGANPKDYLNDVVVFHLRRPTEILLIFPNGAFISNTYGLLGGNFKDQRRSMTFLDERSVIEAKEGIQRCVAAYIQFIQQKGSA